MAATARWVNFGTGAIDALAGEITRLKAGNPLALVTVIVADHTSEVWLRRGVGSRPGGVANVAFQTWERYALDQVGALLEGQGRRRLSMMSLAAAVRVELRDSSGPLGSLGSHPSTERLVVESIKRLRSLDADVRSTLAASSRPLTRSVSAMIPAVWRRLGSAYDDVDVLELASVQARAHGAQSTALIVALPSTMTAPARRLLEATASNGNVVILVGSVGRMDVDDEERRRVRSWGVDPGSAPPATTGPSTLDPTPQGSTARPLVLSAPDPEAEVRAVIRWCLERRSDGVSWADMAILTCSTEPYLRLLHQHLDLAGISCSGPGHVTVGETVAGRVMGWLGQLVTSDLPRGDVMALLASGPLHGTDGSAVPSSLWDRVSRHAGVVSGRSSWSERLGEMSRERRGRAADGRDVLADRADSLSEFMTALICDLDEALTLSNWKDLASWLNRLMSRLLPSSSRAVWSEPERQAAEQLDLAVGRLGELDGIDPTPGWSAFWAAVDAELARPTRRIGRLGHGVLIGSLDAARGAQFEVVAIVGCTELSLPRPARGDAVFGLTDYDTMSWDAPVETPLTQQRSFLAALASGSTHQMVSFPRSDPRRGRVVRPSRLLDPPPESSVSELIHIETAQSAVIGASVTIDDAEERLARLLRPSSTSNETGSPPTLAAASAQLSSAAVCHASDVLAPGVAAWRARRSDALSIWSGSVGAHEVSDRLSQPLSITSLETLVKCPMQYFLKHVLGIGAVQRPDDVESLASLDRGTMMHNILQRFIDDRLALGLPESPSHRWTDESRQRAHDIAEEVGAELVAGGMAVGWELNWMLEKQQIHRRLNQFLDADEHYRFERGARPALAEYNWHDDPLPVELPSGRSLQFTGAADRIDLLDDGGISLLDYKTKSKVSGTQREEIMQRIASGALLQLPLYARAAARKLPEADPTRTSAAYWYLLNDGPNSIVDVDLATVDESFLSSLDVISDLVDRGHFPVRPGAISTRQGAQFEHCTYCDFDSVCSNDRSQDWIRASEAPALESFVNMLSGPDARDSASDSAEAPLS